MASPETNRSAFLIGGTNSGSGKTIITLGLLRAFRRRGCSVAPFKCGPDFIDPLFHRQAAGRASYNLDPFFSAENGWNSDSDVSVVEGVMGLFDGPEPGSVRGSSAEIAIRLKVPVFLTVNAHGMSNSIAPMVRGFCEWHPNVRIAGVFVNRTGSARHADLLKTALEKANLPPLLGALARNDRWLLPERHLGLSVGKLEESWLDALADEMERSFQLDRILECSKRSDDLEGGRGFPRGVPVRGRLGVAFDDAFCFYYEENFDLFRRAGIECVFFSPLTDSALPENLDALYFGGGYPELYADRLSRNSSMLESIRSFAASGRFVYGECGGYLYLLERISDFENRSFPLLNLLPGESVMERKLSALGYRVCETPWGTVRGHEFHYSRLAGENPPPPCFCTASDLRGGRSDAGSIRSHVMGSYIHLHFASNPEALQLFLQEIFRS